MAPLATARRTARRATRAGFLETAHALMTITPTDLVNAGADVPAGFKPTDSGLLVPETMSTFEREDWPLAKVELLQRAGKFAHAHGTALSLACEDDRCKHDPVLRRVDISEGFVLACHHKIRVCVDRRRLQREQRRVRTSAHRRHDKTGRRSHGVVQGV
jgi:hypothetical protein